MSPSEAAESSAIKVFVSYAHHDDRRRQKLNDHLASLKRDSSIEAWDDRQVLPGQDWPVEIGKRLEEANLIILLVSAKFLNSNFCWEIETKRALERHALGEIRVIPVILTPCDWRESPLGSLNALPTNGRPISEWGNAEKAFEDVVAGIRRVISDLKTSRERKAAGVSAELAGCEKVRLDEPFPVRPTGAQEQKVAVCFADIRNFAKLAHSADARANGRISQVLGVFFESLNFAISTATTNIHGDLEFKRSVLAAAIPRVTKALGNAAMLVWRLPNHSNEEIQTGIALSIVDVVSILQTTFRQRIREVEGIGKLDLAVALSFGNALEISGLGVDGVDYVGIPVIQAIRLLEYARPCGIAVNMELAPKLFMERFCASEGRINDFELEIGNLVPAWREVSSQQIRPRIARQAPASFDAAKEFLRNMRIPPASAASYDRMPNALTQDDTVFVFDVREDWEATFAADLAKRVRNNEIPGGRLDSIGDTVREMRVMLDDGAVSDDSVPQQWTDLGVEFHSQIAELSHPNEGSERGAFTGDIYRFTKAIYGAAVHNRATYDQVVVEHSVILSLIRDGDAPRARRQMKQHLHSHFERACVTLLREDWNPSI